MIPYLEDLKAAGVPLKELTKDPNSGFQELASLKEILNQLKDLSNMESFNDMPSLKEGFTPLNALKIGPGNDPKSDKNDDKKDKNDNGDKGNKNCKNYKNCKKDNGKKSSDSNRKDDNKKSSDYRKNDKKDDNKKSSNSDKKDNNKRS